MLEIIVEHEHTDKHDLLSGLINVNSNFEREGDGLTDSELMGTFLSLFPVKCRVDFI